MDEQVGDGEHGVIRAVADVDIDNAAVLFGNDAHEGERGGDPVVGLHAAVVVRVEVRHIACLEGGVLLEVETRAVHVRAQDIESLLQRALADLHEHEGLAVVYGIDFVAGLERLACGNRLAKLNIAGLLGSFGAGANAEALGLVLTDEFFVAGADLFEFDELLGGVLFPCAGAFHVHPFDACGLVSVRHGITGASFKRVHWWGETGKRKARSCQSKIIHVRPSPWWTAIRSCIVRSTRCRPR